MANHVRRQLREAVATAVTGLTTTGSNVFQSRIRSLATAAMPGLLVFTTSEDTQPVSVQTLIERDIEIRIEGYAKPTSDLDDTLDLIGKEVEIALASGVTISGKNIALIYLGCEIEFNDGETPTGSITLRFSAKVFTTAGAPDVFN